MQFHVIFQPSGIRSVYREEISLLEAARRAGVFVDTACGGGVSCGKCRLRVVKTAGASALTAEEKGCLTEAEIAAGWRLGCAATISGDTIVEIPVRDTLKQVILEEGRNVESDLSPAVVAYRLSLPRATLEDNRTDWQRVVDSLSEMGVDAKEIDYQALKELPGAIRHGRWQITLYLLYGEKVIGVRPGWQADTYGLAVDLGTSTVAVYLCSLSAGEVRQTGSFVNPQVTYGDDVISRIAYCSLHAEGVETLQRRLVEQLNICIGELAEKEGIESTEIVELVLAGNTVMQAIALGAAPDALGRSPFVSPTTGSLDIPARELGLSLMPGANIHFLPGVAGFVGADHVAALLALKPYRQEGTRLVIDIGTNSEICLCHEHKMFVVSCASGPALEGAQIRFGMRAAPGAVEGVTLKSVFDEPELKIIGTAGRPVGICGSGIVDAIAQLAANGIIKASGQFLTRDFHPRIRRGHRDKLEYVLYRGTAAQEQDITITAGDIRAVQLAKAALFAGAQVLMKRLGVTAADEILLAGAFGNYINCNNAKRLGFFPPCSPDSISPVGNAAGVGARLALLSLKERREADWIANNCTFVETAAEEDFHRIFAQAMGIPA